MTDIFIVSPRIDLPEDLRLEVEFDAAVEEIQELSADGGLMAWTRKRLFKKNALIGGPDTAAISRETLLELVSLASSLPGPLSLSYIGRTIDFTFDYADGQPVTATAITPRPNAGNADLYNNLRIAIIER